MVLEVIETPLPKRRWGFWLMGGNIKARLLIYDEGPF